MVDLDKTQDEVGRLKAQIEAICAALGIQAVDEFLRSVMSAQSVSVDNSVEPAIDSLDLKKLPNIEG